MNAPEPMSRQLFDLPPEMAALPIDKRGYPVPEFVAWIKGEPDFRVIKPGWWQACVKTKGKKSFARRCWLCGGGMGGRYWFVTGPMCTVTRTTSEPPCHRLCAEFAVKNCPFMTKPLAKRNERDLPEDTTDPGGIFITRNPGVTAIWETRSFEIFKDGNGAPLISMGPPDALTFWREGRLATRAEVAHSIETGLPALADAAKAQGPAAQFELARIMDEYRDKILPIFKAA